MNILRYCKHCGIEFIAHKMSTLYCCRECERKESRQREIINKKKLMQVEDEDYPENILANTLEFLRPSQTAALLGVSRATIYRYAQEGVIKAVQFKRLTIIHRSDIDKYFNEAPVYKMRISYRKKKEVNSEYYSTLEIHEKYHICRKAILARCDKYNIPKVYEGRNTFFKKVNVDAHFAELIEAIDLTNYYTKEQLMEKLNMGKQNVLTFTHRHSISSKVEFGKLFYSKNHIDKIKKLDFDGKEKYYSIQDIIDKFNATKDIAFYYSNKKNITNYKCGKLVYLLKKDIDEYTAQKAAKNERLMLNDNYK